MLCSIASYANKKKKKKGLKNKYIFCQDLVVNANGRSAKHDKKLK